MARGGGKRRTYVRDNRGRFASTGATARGGRLKTAAGNKRKTVTARMAPAKAAGTIGKRKGLKAVKSPNTQKKRIKTDAQIAVQIKRISDKAFDRNKLLGERTISRMEGAANQVVTRARQRRERALANIDRLYKEPNAAGRKNYQRILRQDNARQRHYDLAWFADNISVKQNNEIVRAAKRSQYEKSTAGKNERRRKLAAERKASKEWARRKGY